MNLNPAKYLLIRKIRYLLVVVALILYVASGNIIRTGQSVFSELYFILKNPFLSYYEKIGLEWGYELNLFGLIKDKSPPTALIVAPFRVRPWNILANGEMLPYFLYPRKHKKADMQMIEDDESITHVMVAWGSWWGSPKSFYGWPKFPVNVKKFSYLPTERSVSIEDIRVEPVPLKEGLPNNGLLLQNTVFDSEKEVNYHGMIQSSEARQVESFDLVYTSSSYDYWMKKMEVLLVRGMMVRGKVAGGTKRSANLIAQVKYDNGKSSIFCSSPNETVGYWEDLSIEDLYEKAERYAWVRGWTTKKMWISGIGVNTGRPRGMPYLERYGIIEVERGQNGLPDSPDPQLETAPLFLARGNYFRAKNEIRKAIAAYELTALLDPANAWIHFDLGYMYQKVGEIDKAVKEYQDAIRLEGDVAWFYFALGELYRKENISEDLAIEYLEKSVELDSSGVWAHAGLGTIYRGRQKEKEAYEHFKAGSLFGSYSRYSRYSLRQCETYDRLGHF